MIQDAEKLRNAVQSTIKNNLLGWFDENYSITREDADVLLEDIMIDFDFWLKKNR